VLSEVIKWCTERGVRLKALVMFGSYVFNPVKAKDIDLIVVLGELNVEPKEVILMGVELSLRLRRTSRKSYDVILMDEKSFYENLQPGTVLSGLILGYKVLYDELGIDKAVSKLMKLLASTDYKYFKGRWIDLSTLAKAKKVDHT